jgi:hypothetical protein
MIPKEHPLIQFLDVFQKEADMAGERSIAPISNNTSPQTSKAAARDRAADKPGGIGAAASFSQTLWNDGRPLPEGLRSAMQSRFSYDFSDVRIHADDRAGTLADSIGANAFTVENHIVFGTSKFSPHDGKGRRLIAHELAHVVQQQPLPRDVAVVPRLGGLTPSRRGDAAEREAEAVALRADRGETVAVRESVHEVLQADWGIGALLGGIAGGVAGALIGGPIGALIGAGIGLVGGAIIGGLAAGNSIFPSYSDIVGDADAQKAMTSSWSSTEAAATATTRREEAFWIRLNKKTRKYEFGAKILGPSVGPTTGGSAIPGSRPADSNPGKDDAIYTVGLFHTHTPTAFRPTGRGVGPSNADENFHQAADVAGIIYDYVESPAGSGNIPAGHPIGSPAQLYHSGPDRRQKA